MKITLFTKSAKPTVKEVIEYLRRYTDKVTIFEGAAGEPFPHEAFNGSPDIVISYLSSMVIPGEVLNRTKLWNINFHPGPPEYPGIGCFNFAIYNNEKTYGVTAHLMEKRVDTGRILSVRRFKLLESDSVYDLSKKTYSEIFSVFCDVMNTVLEKRKLPYCDETWKRKPYKRNELDALCKIDTNMPKEEIARRIKASTYPNMPGAYVNLNGYKFEYSPESKKKDMILIGSGGHARSCIDAINTGKDYNIYGILDPALKKGARILNIPVLGGDEILEELFNKGIKLAFIGVGSIGDCTRRKEIYKKLKKIGFTIPVVIHKSAVLAVSALIEEGAYIGANAVINPNSKIGKNTIINTYASIDHDCTVEDFAHIAPRATLSGGVLVRSEAHIGIGANILQMIDIGRGSIVGAGTTVRHNMKEGARNFGKGFNVSSKKRNPVFIIAEAGVNHGGSLEIAKTMIDKAKEAGADAVKFQRFNAEKLVSSLAPKAEYQKRNVGEKESHLEMLKKLELDINAHKELMDYCIEKEILFLSSPFDMESIDQLEQLGLAIFKIPSGEITNMPYLKKIGRLAKRVIISTGMSTLEEIESALGILIDNGTKKDDITIMHCNTEYPTPHKDTNLMAILTLKESLKVDVGYSDHTTGIEVPIAAVALGASVIEKHFTLDKNMHGPDHKASLEPDELKGMVLAIRKTEEALGSGIKEPAPSELKNIDIVRKSVVAAREIKEGELFQEDNIIAKRPARGISPMKWGSVIGRPAKRNFKKDEFIEI